MKSKEEAHARFRDYFLDLREDAVRGGYRVDRCDEWERFVKKGVDEGEYPPDAVQWKCPRSFKTGASPRIPVPKALLAVRFVPTFVFDDGVQVQFWPETSGAPQAHKVLLSRTAVGSPVVRDYAPAGMAPDEEAARYFHSLVEGRL